MAKKRLSPCRPAGFSGVSLAIATKTEHLPLDFERYLPECWANDAARRTQARVPDAVNFKTKIDLALGMAPVPGKRDQTQQRQSFL
ncbi:MAG: transposase [Polyangiaceae bacterium]